MDSPAREADIMTQRGETDVSTCPMVLLPPELKTQIISHISPQGSLSCLSQSCRAWYEVANEELYKRDSRENNSFAIKWMAAHAVDDQTTDSALRTLNISRRWGGQINAVKRRLSQSDRARLNKDQIMYEMSTALHFAVFLENMRLTETLLDIKASLEIPCSNLLQQFLGSEEVLLRVSYFRSIFCRNLRFGSAFPIFLAFLQSNPDMCKLLVEHGAGREAMIVYLHGDPKAMSILHFAAADQTTDYRQWQCLFDGFREYIDEPCPRESQSTPLHVALITGCTQGMQIAVKTGADKESRDGASRTPLSSGIMEFSHCTVAEPKPFEERMMCLRKFVNLGGSVNPDGASLLGFAVQRYVLFPTYRPDLRHVIHFLLEHHVDINRTFERNTNMVNEIIVGTIHRADHLPSLESLRELLRDSIDRGLNLTSPAPELPSPLYRVLNDRKAEPDWLFDLLCENGATIHEHEVNYAFRRWCGIPRLWETNNYNAWWQHKGQEDEIFQKWCEHPYNAWWWQHVKHISPQTVELAYAKAFCYGDRKLYDLLTHLPLPGSTVGRPLCQDLFAAMELEPSFGTRV